MAETLQQFFFRQLSCLWKTQTVGALVNHHLRSLKLSHFVCLSFCHCPNEWFAGMKKMKQKLICQDQIVRRWNYTHQDQSRSNVGECSLWQGNDQNGFYTAFGRPKTCPISSPCPTGGKLRQDREKTVTTIKVPMAFLKGSIHVWSAASSVQVTDTILMQSANLEKQLERK